MGQNQELVTSARNSGYILCPRERSYFVREDKNIATAFPRVVEVGPTRDGRVAILSGVTEDELIVTAGQISSTVGAEVRLDNSSGFR